MSRTVIQKYRSRTDLEPTEYVELSWWMSKDDSVKRSALHKKMYGYKITIGEKEYFYDGILAVWRDVNGEHRRLDTVKYIVLGACHIAIPKSIQPQIENILTNREVDHRWHPYLPKSNVLVVFTGRR